MPWYRVKAEVEIEVQAPTEEDANLKAETLGHKKIVGQTFGGYYNDRAEIKSFDLVGTDSFDRCPDCGEEGEGRGHYGCQYPSNDPEIEGLDDPMMRER